MWTHLVQLRSAYFISEKIKRRSIQDILNDLFICHSNIEKSIFTGLVEQRKSATSTYIFIEFKTLIILLRALRFSHLIFIETLRELK